MNERTLCALSSFNGKDCNGDIPPDAPIELCGWHLQAAYLYVRDLIAAADPEALAVEAEQTEAHERKRAARKSAAPKPSGPGRCVVYYIRFGDRIKIGTTKNIWQRIGSIPSDRLLATEPGSYELEAERHEQFKAHRLGRHEWFADCPEIRHHVNQLRIKYGDPVDGRYSDPFAYHPRLRTGGV